MSSAQHQYDALSVDEPTEDDPETFQDLITTWHYRTWPANFVFFMLSAYTQHIFEKRNIDNPWTMTSIELGMLCCGIGQLHNFVLAAALVSTHREPLFTRGLRGKPLLYLPGVWLAFGISALAVAWARIYAWHWDNTVSGETPASPSIIHATEFVWRAVIYSGFISWGFAVFCLTRFGKAGRVVTASP